MSNVLSARLKRLEQRSRTDPFAHMSEGELAGAIVALDRRIHAATGLEPIEYAGLLDRKMHGGQELPDGVREDEARQFIRSFQSTSRQEGQTHVR